MSYHPQFKPRVEHHPVTKNELEPNKRPNCIEPFLHPYRCELCPKTAEQCPWKYNETIRHVGCATFLVMFEPMRSKGYIL